jgi:hypothetical protein
VIGSNVPSYIHDKADCKMVSNLPLAS